MGGNVCDTVEVLMLSKVWHVKTQSYSIVNQIMV